MSRVPVRLKSLTLGLFLLSLAPQPASARDVGGLNLRCQIVARNVKLNKSGREIASTPNAFRLAQRACNSKHFGSVPLNLKTTGIPKGYLAVFDCQTCSHTVDEN